MNIKRKKEKHLSKTAILYVRSNIFYTDIFDLATGEWIGIATPVHVPKSESNVTMIVLRGKHK